MHQSIWALQQIEVNEVEVSLKHSYIYFTTLNHTKLNLSILQTPAHNKLNLTILQAPLTLNTKVKKVKYKGRIQLTDISPFNEYQNRLCLH
jgi:hypothetical protein